MDVGPKAGRTYVQRESRPGEHPTHRIKPVRMGVKGGVVGPPSAIRCAGTEGGAGTSPAIRADHLGFPSGSAAHFLKVIRTPQVAVAEA